MFLLSTPAAPYADPWDLPLHRRMKMLASGRFCVAYFYEQANNSTFRYRAYNMVQVLNHQSTGECSASFFFQKDLHRIEEIADLADVLVICRSGYNQDISRLVMKFRARGKRVLFDVDDLVFDSSYTHLIINSLNQNVRDPKVWDFWFAYVSRLGATLRICDGAITTNDLLARKIAEFSGLPVNVVPNFINKEQLELSENLYREKLASGFRRDERVHLGYFSGSPSHDLDFAIVEPALEQVLENHSNVEILVAGYIQAGPRLTRFGKRVNYRPFRDYVNLQRLISRVELNLMPLQANAFTDSKSELKYFEAAIVGTQCIASPSYTYARAITNGRNGYIAQAHRWAPAIQGAIDNIARYPSMAATAYTDAREKFAWFNQRDRILRALGFAYQSS